MKVLVSFVASCTVALLLCTQPAFSQGSLTPPGPPAPMMKTLEQIEPRIPITNLPWTITAPGSYYLVTNLVGDAVAPDGIIVQVNDVTIDLRGFVLQGGAAGGNGIAVYNPVTGLNVYNGVIRDWLGSGLAAVLADNGELKELRVSNNGGAGLNEIGNGWMVASCVFANNINSPGLHTMGRSTLKSCTATGNMLAGLAVGTNSVVIGCTASGNFMGIVTFQGGRVVDCTAEGNAMDGFFTGPSTSLSGCIAWQNLQHGFEAMENNRLADCVAEHNQAFGFFAFPAGGPPWRSGCRISGCTAEGNMAGFFTGPSASLSGCIARENLQDGFDVNENSRVADCVAENNQMNGFFVVWAGGPPWRSGCKISGCTATENLQDGFFVMDGSTVENCVATVNQNNGIDVGSFC
jgi:hypothetical protein